MIKSTVVSGNVISTPTIVFTSSRTGEAISGGNLGQTSAITTIILCNVLLPTITDESVNSVNVNIYLVTAAGSVGTGTMIVSNLTVPAGETVFFSDERIILDSGDKILVGATVSNAITVTVSSLPV